MVATVLLVEDEPSHERLFSEFLGAMGWATVSVRTAKEALAVAPELGAAAIIIDILLPDMDGRVLISRLRAMPGLSKTPIVAISAVPDLHVDRECLAAGADVFLRKPIALRDFGDQLASLMI